MVSLDEVLAIGTSLSRNNKAGGMRAEFYSKGDTVYLFSSSGTMMLRFQGVRPSLGTVKFNVLDYDGGEVKMSGDKVTFTRSSGSYQRQKTVSAPKLEFKQLDTKFQAFCQRNTLATVSIGEQVLKQVEEDLSHVEFKSEKGQFKLIQRDIYSGAMLEVTYQDEGLFGGDIPPFPALALKTSDFMSLFLIESSLSFSFGQDVTRVRGKIVDGVVAMCVYDEMMEITEVEEQPSTPRRVVRRK
jgi:hypothetical protein